MSKSDTEASPALSRRQVLGGLCVGMTATSGCLRQTRNILNRSSPDQLSITIKTTPAETDMVATTIGRQLETNLTAAGMDVQLIPMAEEELYRDILINHDFDLYIARHPGGHDPDFLRPLLHSRFSEEPGWQNPFGFGEFAIDGLLTDQFNATGSDRHQLVDELQYLIAQYQPFTVVVIPNDIRGIRTDGFVGWDQYSLTSPLAYLALDNIDDPDPESDRQTTRRLTVAVTDERVTLNFNPIAVEFRNRGPYIDLVYDSLVRWDGAKYVPWLADSWAWDDRQEVTQFTLTLRDDLRWHDGTALTASDVAFTYRFLKDTSLDTQDITVPAPRYRGRVSLVTSVSDVDDQTVQFMFEPTNQTVCLRSLTVPVLPRHIWESKASPVDIGGFEVFDGTPEALVWNNPNPIGSGPFAVQRIISNDSLVLERNEDHFLTNDPENLDQRFHGGPEVDQFVVRVAPSQDAAVELLRTDQADATGESVKPSVVPQIGRHDAVSLKVTREPDFYHIGYNTRHPPTSNANFRRVVARLIDKTNITDHVFNGYAAPAASPLEGSTWISPRVRWDGEDPLLPFLGEGGDLDEDEAVAEFEAAGYQYSESGELLARTN